MSHRLRSARFAGLALALAAPIVAVSSTPALAAGESTTALLTAPVSGSATTFAWTYSFGGGQHGLSNIAIGFCSSDILADVVSASPSAEVFKDKNVPGGHTGFGPGIKFGVTAATGALTVTFASPHAISPTGLRIQSHSGDGQTGDTVNVAPGPGPCPDDPPVTTTTSTSTTTTSTTTTPTTGTTDTTTTTVPSTSTTTAGPTTEVGGTTSDAPIAVLGETLEKGGGVSPGSLARTGAGKVMFLVTLALSLLAAGTALLCAFRRRRSGSVASPG
ncbi:MAG TPA: hypothetical protein VFS16_08690 [Acidimicrobiia bacterium]|nr:hypothetical protein [Acidimicrobiia bacterium]